MLVLALLACSAPDPSDPKESVATPLSVPWSKARAPLNETSPAGRAWARGMIHVHSHYSHDACDDNPWPDGIPDEACLADFRYGLCATAMDFAFITDHPSHSGEVPYEDVLLRREGDDDVDGIATRMHCGTSSGASDSGASETPAIHDTLMMPGIEDELMPVGLDRHVAETPEENDRLYNQANEETILAEIAAGGVVLQAHTEGKELSELLERQAWGQSGVEIFNLHAMFDPNKREEDLGLDPLGYLSEIGPFLTPDAGAEPDLLFLGVLREQTVSLERWDALNAVAPSVGTGGTDAHQNVLAAELSDGERMDSYRRMMSWFSNVLLTDGNGPGDYQAALAAGRLFVAFEVLGTPTGFEVSYGDLEMGGTAALGDTLHITCPTLSPDSPQEGEPPEITVTVMKDGAPWQTDCGDFPVTEPGVYRVEVDIVPHHLAAFLGTQAEALIHEHPWLYSNALRIGI